MKTDARITYLLHGGETLLATIDPEGIAPQAKINRLCLYKSEEDVARWYATLAFPDGSHLKLSGTCGPEGLSVESARIPTKDGEQEIPTKAAKTLTDAFVSLDGLPARLKKNLSPTVTETDKDAKSEPFSAQKYYAMVVDALCWGTEGGKDEKTRARFKKLKAAFQRNREGSPESVCLEISCSLEKGAVCVSANMNVFGMSGKKATAQKDLGEDRSVSADCTVRKDEKEYPSIKAAFALYNTIPTVFQTERKIRKGMGWPKNHQ